MMVLLNEACMCATPSDTVFLTFFFARVVGFAIWLNPAPQGWWAFTQSTGMIRQLMDGRMFPLTLEGLEGGISLLSKGKV